MKLSIRMAFSGPSARAPALKPRTPSTTVHTAKYAICHPTDAKVSTPGTIAAPSAIAAALARTRPTAPGMQVITVKRSGDQPAKRLAARV